MSSISSHDGHLTFEKEFFPFLFMWKVSSCYYASFVFGVFYLLWSLLVLTLTYIAEDITNLRTHIFLIDKEKDGVEVGDIDVVQPLHKIQHCCLVRKLILLNDLSIVRLSNRQWLRSFCIWNYYSCNGRYSIHFFNSISMMLFGVSRQPSCFD